MTELATVPAAPTVPPFPALGDPNFNQLAYDNGSAMPGVSAGLQAIALTAFTNATVAGEKAAAAALSKAATDADAIATAADRVQTSEDRVQTGIDKTAAAASAVQASKLNLGSKSSPPAVDNQGAVLLTGATYYDTTLSQWRVWNGSAWVEGISAVAGVASVNGASGAVTVQPTLVSGTNIKTINGVPVLGAGDIAVGSSLLRSARTSNAALAAADKGTLIDITSGTFTQTFDAAATLGDGWWCYLRNSGTGDITLDPDGAETIDGRASYVMYPGEVRLIQSDGTALRSIVLNAFYKTFTASGTFTKPPGYSVFEGLLWAAGGSGAKDPSYVTGGGGGACAPISFPFSKIGATEVVTIGAGGSPSATTSGNAGGNSSFGALAAAYGGTEAGTVGTAGNGGSSLYSGVAPSNAGSAVLGGADMSTFVAFYGGGSGAVLAGRGWTVFGGAGGAGIESSTAQPVHSATIYGGAGGASGDAVNGSDGVAPAGGGGSTRTGTQSGAGARGELRIWGKI